MDGLTVAWLLCLTPLALLNLWGLWQHEGRRRRGERIERKEELRWH